MAEKKDDSNWMQTLWRPAMGWMYMLICLLDMAVFPVLWSLLQAMMHVPITQWNPLTLQGAGLFHIAMGAVLGISAFGRTQEKLAGTAANPTATSTITTQNTNMSGVPAGMGNMNMGGFNNTGGFGNMNTGGFGSQQPAFGQTPSFGTPTPAFGTPTPAFGTAAPTPAFGAPMPAPVTGQVASGFGGKPAPVLAPDPII
jgi:Holin of 3TMs, for gene-transfer release